MALLAVFSALAAAAPQSFTNDWQQVSALAQDRGLPVVVVVTGDGCGYCERLRREFLADPENQGLLDAQAVTREFARDTGGKITDFDGDRVRSRLFLSRYDVFATPTLLFLGADGSPLAAPLVGYNDPSSYRSLLAERLHRARLALEDGTAPGTPAVAVARP
jgi:thioredoxin-related protein